MNASEVGTLVNRLARDLRLTPEDRYALSTAAKSWLSKSDVEIRREAHAMADRATSSVLGGALNLLGLAMRESRFMESLSDDERSEYEASMTVVGASGLEIGDVDIEAALADADAHEAAGRAEHATAIRAAVARHEAAELDEE